MSQTDSATARTPDPSATAPQAEADTAALAKGGRTNFFGFVLRLVARLPFLYFAGRWYGPEAVGRFAFAVLVIELVAQLATLGLKRGLAEQLSAPGADQRTVVWDGMFVAFLASAAGGIVFDYHGPDRFKFAALRADTGEVIVGRYTEAAGFEILAAAHAGVAPGGRSELSISVTNLAVSVRVDGRLAIGHTFGSSVTDGLVGLLLIDAWRPFGVGSPAIREIALGDARA